MSRPSRNSPGASPRRPLPPGSAFELQVKAAIESTIGYQIRVRELCRGKVGIRPHECDLHAVKVSRLLRALQSVFFCLLVVTVLAYLVAPLFYPPDDRVHLSEVALIAALFGLCWLWHWSIRKTTHHVWIECKSGIATIKRDDVNKLHAAVEDVRAFDNAPWRPTEVWLVSQSEFDQDALVFAAARKITCFRYREGILCRETGWSSSERE